MQRAQRNDELQAALDDGLEDDTQGAEVIVTVLRNLLDEWLQDGQQTLDSTTQGLEPFKWLAISDHLKIVAQFRQLL